VGAGARVPGRVGELGLDWAGAETESHPRMHYTRQWDELSARGEHCLAVSHRPYRSAAWEYFKPDTGSNMRWMWQQHVVAGHPSNNLTLPMKR